MTAKRIPATVRLEAILAEVENNGHASVSDIAERLGVSEMTIRRDMDKLGAEGHVVRTHGGAHSNDDLRSKASEMIEPSVENRATRNRSEKKRIAASAVRLIEPRSTVAIDVGTTCFELASLISDSTVHIVCASLPIQRVLAKNQMQIYAPCGRIAGADPSTVGAQTVAYLRDFRFEIAFLAVAGITEDGLFDYSFEDAEIKKTLAMQAHSRVLMLDSSKVGKSSAVRVMGFDSIDVLITDAPLPPEMAAVLADLNVDVVLAP
ncbi:MAG: DeoR/GlpR family DNA-binding transcription regulator [Sulfitobacter sp.]|uniref:DeoR/GlpR family DNA-binding transcription regulator n=1 Tax=Alphaproteobacteria TaxID=28211 RepID=UPI0029427F88|nr:DeoR/GlpR family DNA-binding transcription regulator [Sulfitobacter sp. LC.270.F.C4]WOI16673.1 DeoR/GlpR family DNA-binding transcription regulator [Sulfitobacter sp. LC.270.F.C4]